MKDYKTLLLMKFIASDEMPLVSIVMCTCNAELFLQQQLNSILQQTYTALEIIIIDDASTDVTQDIILEYAEADKRIRYIFNDTKLGFNKNLETSISLSSTANIAVAEQDGIWELNKIEAMMKHWPEDCNFIYSLSKEFNGLEPKRNEGNKILNYYAGSKPQKLFFDTPIYGHACIFQKSLIADALPFPAEVSYDWWLSVIASSTGKVGCVPLTLTYQRLKNAHTVKKIVNSKTKQEQLHQMQKQRITSIDLFLQKSFIKNEVRIFLLRYKKRLTEKKDNFFSITFFLFYLRNSNITFHYKVDMTILSLLKHSFRRAFTGL